MTRHISDGFRRRRRVADDMTPELYACVERSQLAERAGDVTAALEWHRCVPMFRKGRHREVLGRLADLGDDVPGWVWARWIVYQSLRCEDGDTGRLVQDRLRQATEELHADLMEDCFRHQGDPIQVIARVLGESWAFHQRVAHEGGGLVAFVDEFATGRLVEHAALARRWAGARLSGYELGESGPGATLSVREAGGDEWVDVLDLGARACAPGGWVLGRLVPSGVGDRLMFDMPPLGVPAAIASEVANRPDGDWWRVLTTLRERAGVRSESFLLEDFELLTDVRDLDLLRFGTAPRDLGRVMQQLREGRDEVSRAAYRILERARTGDVEAADQAYVGAAVLNVAAFGDLRRQMVRSDEPDCWAQWVGRLVEPARGRVEALARLGRRAA